MLTYKKLTAMFSKITAFTINYYYIKKRKQYFRLSILDELNLRT